MDLHTIGGFPKSEVTNTPSKSTGLTPSGLDNANALRRTTDTISAILQLSEETSRQLADLAQQQQRTLEEMLRICLVVYEKHCFQQAHQQMLADELLLPLPMLGRAAEAEDDFEPEPIPGKPLSKIILEDRC